MISPASAAQQVMRLKTLQGFAKATRADVEARVMALAKNAANDRHAADIVQALLDTCQWWPAPAEIVRKASEVPVEQSEPVQRLRGCQACGGSGRYAELYLVTWDGCRRTSQRVTEDEAAQLRGRLGGIGVQEIYQGSRFCACELGQRLRQKRMEALATG